MNAVASLLARGRKAKPDVSAVDAVMGKDWAIVSPGRARKAREARLGLKIAHARDVARFAGGGGGGVPGGKPQAVVKMVRSGGVSDLRGLRAQMAYLSRKGEEPLERSERYMGLEVDPKQAQAMERSWQMPRDGEGGADRTSHFIVSFPQDTDPNAAHRAGRAWAEEMFGSGKYGGDSYDYYTAFHTDRAHPHMHVVVYRRGLEHGEWLKVSRRSDLNYDRMREELVRVAARSGVELEASTRFARGRHDRPVADAEYRRAAAERRPPEAPTHTRETAIRAAAAMIHYARVFATNARRLEREAPEQAALLRHAAKDISHGRELLRQNTAGRASEQEGTMASPRIEEKRVEVRQNFEVLDSRASEIDDRAVRMRFLRQIESIKAETAPLLREPGALRAFMEKDDSGRYRGLDASTEQRADEKQRADARVRTVAVQYGVDGGATVERHAGPPPSRGLARQFAEAESQERDRTRAARGEAAETPEQRQAALSKMHTEIRAIYQEGRDRLEGRIVRPEPARPAAPAAAPSGSRDAETGEALPDRVAARIAKDAERTQAAERIWQQREAEHHRAMERAKTPERPQSERDTRSRGDDDTEEASRRRGRKR